MKKFLLLAFILLLTNSIIFAQSGKISGTISDATTGEALIGVNIIVEGTSLGAATDVDGFYVILNVSPGTYNLKASYIGFAPQTITNLRVNIGQTSEANFKLSDQSIQTDVVVVVATTPVVQRDVASSGANLNAEEIKNLPVVNIASVVGLQAGVDGGTIRGGSGDEVVYEVNGISMRDGRDNSSYNNLSMTAIKQIRVQSGGFTADVGDVRSGLIEVVTKEGDKHKYTVSFQGQYRPASNKHFGQSVNDPNSYYIRPFVDDDVAWTGTNNGAWDKYMQRQYPEFEGWNAFAEGTLQNDDPTDDLTPEAAQRLFLWQHRRTFDITEPDYDFDMSISGPVPVISKYLGSLRFLSSFKQNRTMLLVPLSTPDYKDYNASLKLTSDLSKGIKLLVEGFYGEQAGTATSTSGATYGSLPTDPGMFQNDWYLADRVDYGSYTDAVLFSDAYFTPSTIKRSSFAAKLTHAISSTTYYDLIFSNFNSDYITQPGRARDLTEKYLFGNNYYVDEAPFGYYQGASDVWNGGSILMGSIYSQGRDWSKTSVYNLKFDFVSQLDKFNEIKTGFLFRINDYNTHYGLRSELYSTNNRDYQWDNQPLLFAAYVQDKLEFEAMVATIGVRVEYSDPNTEWYDYSPFDKGFSASNSDYRDDLIAKKKVDSQIIFMPRLGIAFPITENSKLFLNYGHYQTLPTPNNLYLQVEDTFGQIKSMANPYASYEKTITYEVGYEHNLLDQYLLRITGYYKDITNQSDDILYQSSDATVSYNKTEPVEYRDIRGFEIQINKNRGDWFTGFINYNYMATSLGKFGWGKYFESPVDTKTYIDNEGQSWFEQTKPIPRPIARINVDFFTPSGMGHLLSDWRLNVLSTWKSGEYASWNGGLGINAESRYNLHWLDYYNTDIRISKTLDFGNFDIQLYVQIYNVFNAKRLSSTGFSHGDYDFDNYLKSLHLSKNVGDKLTTYNNIPGEDRPGDYREDDVSFVPIEAVGNINNIEAPTIGQIYYDANTERYYEYSNTEGWDRVDDSKMQKILKDKAYIDMPNFGFFSFLNPRNIFFGLKFNLEL
ncbi:MAG: TonB-dependent receptor [Bacteroidetes bacterium]|nr:TonB-dependent receptor [Bacteroidota bacterium]MBU1114724.1 TonB-dependent receptor [Bacteroidota bacterium]MBU1798926.1 TonB-dependent receptor [Bacteroidota bacterium]